jgi:hypothetical protein
MKTAPSESTKPSFEKRLRRIVGLVVLSAVVLPILAFLVWRISLSIRLKSKLAAIAKAGYPVSLADLRRMYYPEITPEENGAEFITEAFAHMVWTNTPKAITDYWPSGRLAQRAAVSSVETNALLRSLLTTNEDLLVFLRKAPVFEKSRYPIKLEQGVEIDLPHLQRIRTCEDIVVLDAEVQAHAGHTATAIQDLDAALKLSSSLLDEPVLYSQRIRWSCQRVIDTGLQHVLNEGALTDAQLQELFRTARREENPRSPECALAGERCSAIDWHQHLFDHAFADSSDYQGWQIDTNRATVLVSGIMRIIGILNADLDCYLKLSSDEISIVKNPYPQCLVAAKHLDEQISKSRTYFLASILLSDHRRLAERQARDTASIELWLTALAIERYRLANQDRLPAKLADLVPTFLPSVPQDPFDGQPLRFKPLEKGYVIYSVGPDLTDDGGREWQRRPKGATNDLPYDITFTVER